MLCKVPPKIIVHLSPSCWVSSAIRVLPRSLASPSYRRVYSSHRWVLLERKHYPHASIKAPVVLSSVPRAEARKSVLKALPEAPPKAPSKAPSRISFEAPPAAPSNAPNYRITTYHLPTDTNNLLHHDLAQYLLPKRPRVEDPVRIFTYRLLPPKKKTP